MNRGLRNGEGFQLRNDHPGAGGAPHCGFLAPGNAANDATLAGHLDDVERGGEKGVPTTWLRERALVRA